jgi:hypothetical protein
MKMEVGTQESWKVMELGNKDLGGKVIEAAMAVHRAPGPDLDFFPLPL